AKNRGQQLADAARRKIIRRGDQFGQRPPAVATDVRIGIGCEYLRSVRPSNKVPFVLIAQLAVPHMHMAARPDAGAQLDSETCLFPQLTQRSGLEALACMETAAGSEPENMTIVRLRSLQQ